MAGPPPKPTGVGAGGRTNTLNAQPHMKATPEISGHRLPRRHRNLFPGERGCRMAAQSPPPRLSGCTGALERSGRGRTDTGARQGRPPTHSSSTCFIRRDTLPASLVTRVLHGGHSKSMHKLVGLILRKGERQLRRAPGGWMLQVRATEASFKSSRKQARPQRKSVQK